jgi:hypothetical protein
MITCIILLVSCSVWTLVMLAVSVLAQCHPVVLIDTCVTRCVLHHRASVLKCLDAGDASSFSVGIVPPCSFY